MAKVRSEESSDHVDRFLDEIKDELPPDLDLDVEGIVDRISGIGRRIKKALDETLAESGLSHTDWRLLSALRWAGSPYQRSAGELAKIVELSSGAMTSRLDQLEQRGLVRRLRDPDDRRGVLVEPTDEGKRVWEGTIGVQAQKETMIAAALNDREKKQLNDLLRKVMLAVEDKPSLDTKKGE